MDVYPYEKKHLRASSLWNTILNTVAMPWSSRKQPLYETESTEFIPYAKKHLHTSQVFELLS